MKTKGNSKKAATTELQSTPRNFAQIYPTNFRDGFFCFMTLIVTDVYFQNVKSETNAS